MAAFSKEGVGWRFFFSFSIAGEGGSKQAAKRGTSVRQNIYFINTASHWFIFILVKEIWYSQFSACFGGQEMIKRKNLLSKPELLWVVIITSAVCSSPCTANLSRITDLIHNIGKLPLGFPVSPFLSGLDWLEEPQPQPLQAIKPGHWGCHQPAALSWASADGSS